MPRCIALTEEWAQQNMPEAMPLPGYHTFYRKAKAVPYPVMVLCRMGEKKYYDLCSPYIRREYESINANDFWVAIPTPLMWRAWGRMVRCTACT